MAGRRSCPECGVSVNVENLPAHFEKLHPHTALDPALLQDARKEARTHRPRSGPSSAEKRVYAIGAVVILVVLVAAIGLQQLSRPGPVGGVAPDFSLTTTAGSTVQLAALRGSVVLLDFFSTSCPACQQFTSGTLVSLYSQYGSQFVLISIDVNRENDNAADGDARIAAFMTTYGATWTYALDVDRRVANSYGISVTPTHFIVDASGNIVDRHEGSESLDVLVSRLSQYW